MHHYFLRFRNNLRSESWGRTAERTGQRRQASEPTAGLQDGPRAEQPRLSGAEAAAETRRAQVGSCSTRRHINIETGHLVPGLFLEREESFTKKHIQRFMNKYVRILKGLGQGHQVWGIWIRKP